MPKLISSQGHFREPLEIVIYRHGWRHDQKPKAADPRLVHMLLEAGATLDLAELKPFELCNGFELRERSEICKRFEHFTVIETSSVVLLITFYFKASATRHIAIKILGRVQSPRMRTRNQPDLAWDVIIGIVQTDFAHAINIFTENRVILNSALEMATEKGHVELVKAFLGPGRSRQQISSAGD
jgi:hypothetical protein